MLETTNDTVLDSVTHELHLNRTQLALVLCFRNFRLQSYVKTNDGLVCAIPASNPSTILHCLQWYKLVLRTGLSTAAVQYEVRTYCILSLVQSSAALNELRCCCCCC